MDYSAHLQQTFHLDSFRPFQKQIISAIIDRQDVLAILPTGGGKSLCYQFPATVFPGLTIVISPLLSLMQDQLGKLTEHNIASAVLNSQQTRAQTFQTHRQLKAGEIKILYLSPEKLQSATVRQLLNKLTIDFVCVDEAHCLSQWGHDFRPEYLEIGRFINRLHTRPVVAAFTATATPAAREEIIQSLGLTSPKLFEQPVFRPNLRYIILHPPSEAVKRSAILASLRWWKDSLWGSCVVYAATRSEVELLCSLARRFGFKRAQSYHAGLQTSHRQAVLQKFLSEPRSLLFATSAFGMGVDKPNVRLVIHHSPPTSLEAYCQESGRAGRDGLEAWCLLLYRDLDLARNYAFTAKSAASNRLLHLRRLAASVRRFASSQHCAASLLSHYLSPESAGPTTGCGCNRCQPFVPWENQSTNKPEPQLLEKLKQCRKQRARALKVPPYFLGTNKTLERLAAQPPLNWQALKTFSGMGYSRLRYWGKDILALTKTYTKVRMSGPS